MKPHVVAAAVVVALSSAHAGPAKAPLTAKHVDENGDPKKDSDAAPKDTWWVSCYVNVREKDKKIGTHTLFFGPWLASRTGEDVEDGKKFAALLYAEYEPALGAEFPKYAYKQEQYPQRACMASEHASSSGRYWNSREIGTPHASRSKFVPAFAK